MKRSHLMRWGATLCGGGADFRLWAPAAKDVELLLGERTLVAERQLDGWWRARVAGATAGQRYRWRIDSRLEVPDPASRCNPEGPHGASLLVDPLAYTWSDGEWRGRSWHEAVFYELHIGCFTDEGTWDAARARLPALRALGITALQIMPVADWPGRFGWGYDGVLPFAPFHGYGAPDDFKRFVDAAHALGLMVFLDVVDNHFGPEGNWLHAYAPGFFTERHRTAWGAAIDFGDEAVRDFYVQHALYWLTEYHLDGLRFDAVHAMRDEPREGVHGRPHILEEISSRVRAAFANVANAANGAGAPPRRVHLVLENDSNDAARLAAPGTPGRYEGQWNGDVHHALHVLLTGERDGYYAEYDAPVAQLARCLTHGFAREGGPHNVEGAPPRRAARNRVPLSACVNFLHNHDQIGNRAFGERLTVLAEPAALRLAVAIVLLAPSPPLLFMGDEAGAVTPFLYFADWSAELRDAVRRGRVAEFAHFARYAEAARAGRLPDPCSEATFARCRVQPGPDAAAWQAAYRTLLALRAMRLQPRLPDLLEDGHDAAFEGRLLEVRWRFGGERAGVWTMQVNLGPEAAAAPMPAGERLHAEGEATAAVLGPWSGRWHWLDTHEDASFSLSRPGGRGPG
ncbi:MAG: malto-oligosyltrehalose trehalohydrolase [Betaproteobacteria bacterium]|nr:malto-oligosyltrehalose trehalohydrolase [Betaproteobacteria bacterium]